MVDMEWGRKVSLSPLLALRIIKHLLTCLKAWKDLAISPSTFREFLSVRQSSLAAAGFPVLVCVTA